MSLRKILSLLTASITAVSLFSFGVQADRTSEYQYYTTASGISIRIPSELDPVIWDGMSSEDPYLESVGGTVDDLVEIRESIGLELQAMTSEPTERECFFCIVFETDMPEELNDETLSSSYVDPIDQGFPPGTTDNVEFIGYGTTDVNGIPVYKIFGQVSGSITLRFYDYIVLTNSGKMYQILSMVGFDDAIPLEDDEELCTHLDENTDFIINSLQLTNGLESSVISFDGEAFRMIQGEYAPAMTLENATGASASSDTGSDGGIGDAASADGSAASADANAASSDSVASPTPAAKKSLYTRITSFEFPLIIFLIALAAILIPGAKISKLKEWQDKPFALDTSKAIQGFAAVAIIIHHLSQELAAKAGILGFFSELGVLFVGIFFFFSGYGLYTSLKTKENYLKGFLKKRLVTILIPFYMCILVFVLVACIRGVKFKPLELLAVISGWSLLNSHMWYIVEIAILYLAFFLIYKLIKNRTAATAVMGIFVAAMMAGSLMLCHGKDFSCSYWFQGEWWYNSSFLFVIGIIVSKHADSLRKIARKCYLILLPLFGALTYVFFKLTHNALQNYSYWSEIPGEDPAYLDKIRCLSVQLPWIIFFVFFVLLLMMKVRFGNPVLKFLGSISLELYLIHNLYLTGLRDGSFAKIPSPGMYITLTLLFAIGLATVLSGVDKYLIGLITGKGGKATALSAGSGAVSGGGSGSGTDAGTEAIPELALKKSRIHSIDLMRIIAAFFVVTIHIPFNGRAGQVFITYGKTAVPFFLVVCGYMLFREDNAEMTRRIVKQLKRILIFYLAALAFYIAFLAVYIRIDTGSFRELKGLYTASAIKNLLLYNYSEYFEHLWFLGSLLYALVIFLILNKLKVLKYAMFAGPLLVAAYVILSHKGIGEPYQLRNAVLVGMSYPMVGMIIRRFEKKILSFKALAPILWILLIAGAFTAIKELDKYEQGTMVPFISCEILTVVIFLLCLRYPNFGRGTLAEKLGRDCSLPVYIMHVAFILILSEMFPAKSGFMVNFGAFTVFTVTLVAAALYENIKHAVIQTK